MNTNIRNANDYFEDPSTSLPPASIPMPNANGEFTTPAEGAKFMAAFGIPQIPLCGKAPWFQGWPTKASRDFMQIDAWYAEHKCNFGSVAVRQIGGYFVFEVDSLEVKKRFKGDTGKEFSTTLTVGSRNGGHRWYAQTPESIGLGNVAQGFVIGGDFSVRVDAEQCVSPGSIHPNTGKQYRVLVNVPPSAPTCEEIAWFTKQKIEKRKSTTIGKGDGWLEEPIIEGTIHDRMVAIAGKLRHAGLTPDEVYAVLEHKGETQCFYPDRITPFPTDMDHLRHIADSSAAWLTGEQKKLRETPVGAGRFENAEEYRKTIVSCLPNEPDNAEDIPAFDPSVVNGIYAEFVELITRGTTLAPQFAFVIAKTVVGLRMAGKVKFETLDAEPRYYTALIGETGSGKGEAWRRMLEIIRPTGALEGCRIKIINSMDSGAGLKDFFFEMPQEQPVLCYLDEVIGLENKAKATKNPEILDTIIELANSTNISRTLANRGKERRCKTKGDARLAVVMCGQDGETYAEAFAGRAKMGLWDRLYPEYSVPVEAGDLPVVPIMDAIALLGKLNDLDYSGTIAISAEAKAALGGFWDNQPKEVRTKARFRTTLFLDAYMSAFGRRSRMVEPEDATIAMKIFTRQLAIRRVHFKTEIPDPVGRYTSRLKTITEKMARAIANGVEPETVAKSRRDFEHECHSYRNNEGHIFERAWNTFSKVYLTQITI